MFIFLISRFLVLYILCILTIYQQAHGKIFSHSAHCSFLWVKVSFSIENFSFDEVLFVVVLSASAVGVLFRKMSLRLLPTFSSVRFSVVGCVLRHLITLDCSLMQVIAMDMFAFCYMLTFSHLHSWFDEDAILFLVCISGMLF